MTDREQIFRNRLLRLWKGTALVLVSLLYVALIAAQLWFIGWVTALVIAALILSLTLFRYIGLAVNRVGVRMRQAGDVTRATTIFQLALLLTIVLVVLAHDVAIALTVHLSMRDVYLDSAYAILVVLGLIVIEILHESVRRASIKVQFETALYGFNDDSPFAADRSAAKTGREPSRAAVDRKLAILREMAEREEISQKAFRKTRDRLLVDMVLTDAD